MYRNHANIKSGSKKWCKILRKIQYDILKMQKNNRYKLTIQSTTDTFETISGHLRSVLCSEKYLKMEI